MKYIDADSNKDRRYECLATAIASVFFYLGFKCTLLISKTLLMMEGQDIEVSWLTKKPTVILVTYIALFTGTLVSIWVKFRLSDLLAALGILLLGVGAHAIFTIAMTPIAEMINSVE